MKNKKLISTLLLIALSMGPSTMVFAKGNGNDGCQIGNLPGHKNNGQSNEHKIDYMTKHEWQQYIEHNGIIAEQKSNNDNSNGWITFHIYDNDGNQIEVVHIKYTGDISNPEEPEIPGDNDNSIPMIPLEPSIPNIPVEPETPEEPDGSIPMIPLEPSIPNIPEIPEEPDNSIPMIPLEPSIPNIPELPDDSDNSTPTIPLEPSIPDSDSDNTGDIEKPNDFIPVKPLEPSNDDSINLDVLPQTGSPLNIGLLGITSIAGGILIKKKK